MCTSSDENSFVRKPGDPKQASPECSTGSHQQPFSTGKRRKTDVPDPRRSARSCLRFDSGTEESRRIAAYEPLSMNADVTRNEGAKDKSHPICFNLDCNGAPHDVFRPTNRILNLGSGSSPSTPAAKFALILAGCRVVSTPGETCGILDIRPSLNCGRRGDCKSWDEQDPRYRYAEFQSRRKTVKITSPRNMKILGYFSGG